MLWATEYMTMKTASLEGKTANVFTSLFHLGANTGGGFNAPLKKSPVGPSAAQNAASQALAMMNKPKPMAASAAPAPAAPKPIPMRPAGMPANNPVAMRRMELAAK